MASVFKPKGKSKYEISYKDETGRRRKKVGTTDKAVTRRIANDLENKVALRRAGLIDPRDESYRRHEARKVVDHLADFHAELIARGDTAKHADLFVGRARRVVKLSGVVRISGLSPSKVMGALAILRDEGVSAETINHYIRAAKSFSHWLWRDGRAGSMSSST